MSSSSGGRPPDGVPPQAVPSQAVSPQAALPREGSLDAPTRHPLLWREDSFYDEKALDEEMRRVFDVCHGCRRCFNLCDAFPRLFDLIDESETGEMDSVSSDAFPTIQEACTLCDMCFMTKCPYVPPHPFAIDFPHLMLRHRAHERHEGKRVPFGVSQLIQTDRNGRWARLIAPLANWASRRGNFLTRPLMSWILKIHPKAELPKFSFKTFTGLFSLSRAAQRRKTWTPNKNAPAYGRKAILFPSCIANYNDPALSVAAASLLSHCGVEIEILYPQCCGMPLLEQGKIDSVAESAEKNAAAMKPFLEKGYDVITPTASCSLMFREEWRLILPDNGDVKRLSERSFDISHYLTDIAKKEGLPKGAKPLKEKIAVHLACHARAQNVGARAMDLLKAIPDIDLQVIERCSGHGGTFGICKSTYDVAVKSGKPATRMVKKSGAKHLVSECPLAAKHLAHQAELEGEAVSHSHPVFLLAQSYDLL